jgi:hypothetical protein
MMQKMGHVDDESDEVANGAIKIMAYWHIGLKNYVLINFYILE